MPATDIGTLNREKQNRLHAEQSHVLFQFPPKFNVAK